MNDILERFSGIRRAAAEIATIVGTAVAVAAYLLPASHPDRPKPVVDRPADIYCQPSAVCVEMYRWPDFTSGAPRANKVSEDRAGREP